MKRPTISELLSALVIAACIGAVAWGFWRLNERSGECESQGGVLVRTVGGFACVRVQQ